jgi:hypothetical protein
MPGPLSRRLALDDSIRLLRRSVYRIAHQKSLSELAFESRPVVTTSVAARVMRQVGTNDAEVVARLKPGETLEHAKQSMAALSLLLTSKDFRGPH